MQPRKLFARLAVLSAATVLCLVLALLAPAILKRQASDEPFSGASVMASPRDMLVVTQGVRLSSTPDLVLTRGMLYADGNAALGTPISRFVLDAPVFTLGVTSFDPAMTAATLEAGLSGEAGPLTEQLLAFGYDALTIRRGSIQINVAEGNSETLSEFEAEVSGRRKGQFSARGSFVYRGQRIKFDTAVAQPMDKKAAQRWQVKAAFNSAFLDSRFEGQVDVTRDIQLSGVADVTIPSLRRVARWLSVPVPNAEGLNASSIKGQFTWARNALSFEQAKISIDTNEGTGTLSLNLSAERPLIDGTLAFSSVDLAPYFEGLRPRTFGFERPSTSWANLDLSFPLIRYIDTDLRISTPRVTFKGFEMGRTAATFTVRSGKLLADVAEMELGAATASLQLTADTNEMVPRYTLKGKVQNLDAAQSASALLSGATWSGKGAIAIDVTGAGQAPSEVLRSLSGKAALQMPAGARIPVDIKALRGLVKQAPATGWGAFLKGQTQLDLVDLRLTLGNGVATVETPQARSGSNAFAMSGTLNLPEAELDLRIASRASAPQDRPLRSADFLGADVVRLSGPLSSPVLSEAGRFEGDASSSSTPPAGAGSAAPN